MESFDALYNENMHYIEIKENLVREEEEKTMKYDRMMEDYEIISKTFCKKCMFDEEEIELNQNDEHNDGNNDHDHQDDDENKNMDSMDFMDRDCINIIKF